MEFSICFVVIFFESFPYFGPKVVKYYVLGLHYKYSTDTVLAIFLVKDKLKSLKVVNNNTEKTIEQFENIRSLGYDEHDD